MSDVQEHPAAEAAAPEGPPPAAPARSPIAEKLCEARVALRPDLDVTRHVFRGEVHYALQDPLTFASHSFSVDDYFILTRLTVERTLDECFRSLVELGRLDAEDEERFYTFVFSMHRIGFLKLPVSDGETLYRRHSARLEAKRKQRFTSFLFLPIPLWNPDQFLGRTLRWVRPLCTRTAFHVWTALVLLAGWALVMNWSEFQRPVADIFSGENLPLLWLTLIGLKVAHEFGHAYACKHFGGHVPEMGVMLILFTPCAFVDATASWTFPRKLHRLIVCMAGMYVELFIAAVALLLWTVTPPGVLRQCLHNVVLLASVVTIGFNINPLMRYDGYYALTDLVEMPNLRARSTAYATSVLKKLTLGVEIANRPEKPGVRAFLLAFGVASAVYKVVLVLGISVAIAFKFFVGGLLLGAVYFGGELTKIVKKTLPYLWSSEEVEARRVWARFLGLSLACGVPLAVVGLPVPSRVTPPGVVVGGEEVSVRAEVAGFVEEVRFEPGQPIEAGTPLVRLVEPDKRANLRMTLAELDGARLREQVYLGRDPAAAAEERARIRQLEERERYLRRDLDRLRVTGPVEGFVISGLSARDVGRYVARGDEVAKVTRGRPMVRALLDGDDLASTAPYPGLAVEFRSHDDPTRSYPGVIRRVDPAGRRVLPEDLSEHLDLDEFSLNPVTQETSRSQFEVEVALDPSAWARLRHGMTGRVRLVGETETLGRVLYRKLVTLLNRLEG